MSSLTRPGSAPAASWWRGAVVVMAVATSAGLAGCSGSGPTGASAGPAVTVMTRNMYFGADLSPLFGATASQLGPDATAAFAQLQQSAVPARLEADAREIAAAKPDLVALQEAVTWTVTPPGQTTATVLSDFVAGLRADLARLGAPYAVAASSAGLSGALPVPGVGVVSLQDRDVIIVRQHDRHLTVAHPTTGTYAHVLTVHVAGIPIAVRRGWAEVDAVAGGRRFRVLATHLEAYSNATRDAQAQELVGLVHRSTRPTLVLGDVNSPAKGEGSQTYDTMRRAGLGDAWAAANPGDPGSTCCRSADLRSGALTQRIDMVFTRGAFHVDKAWRVGVAPAARTPGGLWPSDHAGVAVTVVPPA